MSYSTLLQTIREFPYVCEFHLRRETFRKVSVSSPRYECTAEEETYETVREVAAAVQDLYDTLRDREPIDPEVYIRTTWRDDYTFHYEQLLPWAVDPALERVHVLVYVRLTKSIEASDAEADKYLILTDDVVDALAHVRAERAWIAESEPDTILISLPEGWSEIEAGTEPDTEPDTEPEPDQPDLTYGQVAMMTSGGSLPTEGVTYGYLYLQVETHDKILSGSHRYALPYAWERAIDEARHLGRGILGVVCGMIDAEPESYEERRSEPGSEVVWLTQYYGLGECFTQLGLQRITLEWGFQRVEPDQRECVGSHVGERLWIGVATWDGRDLGKRTLAYASNRRADLAVWAKGTAEAAALLMDVDRLSAINGTYTLEGSDESYADIKMSVGFRVWEDNPEFTVKGYRLL